MTYLTASCPALTLSNGDITYTMDNPPIPVGRVATHICSDSFVLSGDATRTCTDSASGGMWSGSMLTCIGKLLSSIKIPIIMVSLQEHVRTYPASLMESLPIHQPLLHVLMGVLPLTLVGWDFCCVETIIMRTCQPDRSWSGTEPFCQSQFSHMCYFLPTFIGIAKTVHESIPYSG